MRKSLNAYPVWDIMRCTSLPRGPEKCTTFPPRPWKIFLFFSLGVPKECLSCSHMAWGFSHLIPALLWESLCKTTASVESSLFPDQTLSLWFPDSTSSCWAPQSPPRFFLVLKQLHCEWGKNSCFCVIPELRNSGDLCPNVIKNIQWYRDVSHPFFRNSDRKPK